MKTIKTFCEKYDMLPKGALVLAAVSGGKDSVFLLHFLKKLSGELDFSLACAHYNHCLRGEESDRDALFVLEKCAELGVPCHVGIGDVAAYAKENGMGIEEAARHLRYAFLERTADEIGASRIATAHTANDNAETLLLNLARGAGLRGLCAIPPVRGRIVRPLLETAADDILDYLRENNIEFVEDSSNALDAYARNALRHHVIPALRGANSRFDENVSRCISQLREDEQYLSRLASDFVARHYRENTLPAKELAALPKPLAARALQQITKGSLSSVHVAAALALAGGEDPHASVDLPNLRVRREYDRLVFGGESAAAPADTPLIIGETLHLTDSGFMISSEYIHSCVEINNSDNTFFFQHGSICGNIVVGARREGEKIRFKGKNGTKTLKKLFSEAKLNGAGKNLVPVLYDDRGPLAVYGFGIAERCAPEPGDDVVVVKIEKLQR